MVAVSLIIPAFNVGDFLDATLRSVARQDLASFECLVVDDFSDDDTLAIARSWRGRDRRIRIITQRARSGVSAARNAGLRAAQGALCAFLDADDLLMQDSLRLRQLAWQKACRSAGDDAGRIAGSYCASEAIAHDVQEPPSSKPISLPPIGFATVGGRCPFNANQPMIRRDVLLEMGGFNEALSQAEDYDLWARILRAGYWFIPSPQVAVTYRSRQGSAIRKAPSHHLAASLALHDAGERPLDSDVLTRSARPLRRAHGIYAHQATKAARVLQFCGMELGSEDHRSTGEIASIISRHLPDLPDILAPTGSVRKVLSAGISRQTTCPPSSEDEGRIAKVLEALSQQQQNNNAIDRQPLPATSFGPFGNEDWDRLWHPVRQAAIDVLFVPHKDYHAWTVGLAAPALRAAGISFAVVDIAPQWREAGAAAKARELGLPIIRYGEIALGDFAPRLIVTFNDWDYVTRPILAAAAEAGIPTAAIVEGIQDYNDDDTGRERHAYQMAQSVLLPGDFDRRYFALDGERSLSVVGIPRVQLLRRQAAAISQNRGRMASRQVLINSNFSHNVMTDRRDAWLTQAVEAVRAAGLDPLITRHPEDKGKLFAELVTQTSFYDALGESCATVQRFATGILESLAARVPVIYFNPHGEKVDKFLSDPMGAYPIVSDPEALSLELTTLNKWREEAMIRAEAFLDFHAGPQNMDSAAAICDALLAAMGPRPNAAGRQRFRQNLRAIDHATDSLTLREIIFDDPKTAVADMSVLSGQDDCPERLVTELAKAEFPCPDVQLSVNSALRLGLVWRGRVALHTALERAYRASARWPWLHRHARRAGEFYKRNLSPL